MENIWAKIEVVVGKRSKIYFGGKKTTLSVCWFGKLRATRATRFGSPKRQNATKKVPRHSLPRVIKYQKYLEKAINTHYSLLSKRFPEFASFNL